MHIPHHTQPYPIKSHIKSLLSGHYLATMVDQTPPQHIPTLINGARCDGTQKPSFGLHLVYIPLYPRYIPDVHNIYPCLYPNWHLKVVPSPCISMGFGHCWCVPSWKCGGLWSSHHHWWDENPLLWGKHHKLLTMANIIIYIYIYIQTHNIAPWISHYMLLERVGPHGTPPVTQHDTDVAEHRRGGSAAVSQLRWAQRSATRAGSGSSSWTSKAHSFQGRGMRLG